MSDRCSLKTLCLYCGYPFGQGEHAHCLKRIKKLQFYEKADQREMLRQIGFLGSKRYKKAHNCPRCGTVCRWRGQVCHAHTRTWTAFYGGVLERTAAKNGVRRYEATG